MLQAPKNLKKLDQLMQIALLSPDQKADFMEFQQALPIWGHTVGWYITNTIIQAGFRTELVETVNSPHTLLALYNDSVDMLKIDQPKFSNKVLNHISMLANKQ